MIYDVAGVLAAFTPYSSDLAFVELVCIFLTPNCTRLRNDRILVPGAPSLQCTTVKVIESLRVLAQGSFFLAFFGRHAVSLFGCDIDLAPYFGGLNVAATFVILQVGTRILTKFNY